MCVCPFLIMSLMAAAVAAAVAQDQEGNLLGDPSREEEAVRQPALPTMLRDTLPPYIIHNVEIQQAVKCAVPAVVRRSENGWAQQ